MRAKSCRGTTLIEILVTIVIFLVGILAVLQIFPKGFQILVNGRNQSVAGALSRDEIERLEARAPELPTMIVATRIDPVSGLPVIDSTVNPNSLGPVPSAATIDQYGSVFDAGGNPLDANPIDGTLDQDNVSADDNWMRFAGANATRHVIGESRIVPAPRLVSANSGNGGTMYGGLIVLNFGPVDFYVNNNTTPPTNSISIYGNDLNAYFPPANAPSTWTNQAILGANYFVSVQHTDDEYFILNPQTSGITLALPTGPVNFAGGIANAGPGRLYIISFSAYVPSTSGGQTTTVRRDFTGVNVLVPNQNSDANGVFPLYQEPLTSLVPNLMSVDLSTLRVRRGFLQVGANATFANYDAYACKLLNPQLGVILFSPYASSITINGPSGPQPLQARIDYDVYDWRILREDFRFPSNQLCQHQLPLGALRIAGQPTFDGARTTVTGQGSGVPIPTNIILPLEGPNSQTYTASNTFASDNFVLVDLDTGGVYLQKNNLEPAPARPIDTYITVNKHTGVLVVTDLNPLEPGTQANLLLPDGSILQDVTIDNRAVRVLYQPKSEFAVQALKSASSYTEFALPNGPVAAGAAPALIGAGQFLTAANAAGSLPTRIYFPISDLGRKVSASVINYRRAGDTAPRQMHDQDFVIAFPALPDGVHLPCIDVANVDYLATTIDVSIDKNSFGYAVGNIKGASVAVRALWNPAFFQLGTDGTADAGGNITKVNLWGQNWRKAVNDTYLEQGDLIP